MVETVNPLIKYAAITAVCFSVTAIGWHLQIGMWAALTLFQYQFFQTVVFALAGILVILWEMTNQWYDD
jgi:hypothetical protein